MKVKVSVRPKKKTPVPEKIGVTTEFIKLDSFLKLANVAETGGVAKLLITEGDVLVNGEVCTQRGRKLRPGDVVETGGAAYEVTDGNVH